MGLGGGVVLGGDSKEKGGKDCHGRERRGRWAVAAKKAGGKIEF